MLRHLYIKNFALIDTLDIELYDGFSVITGETGAGKSIILGALAMLLGQRADSRSLKQGAEKCVIEAHFDLSRYPMDDIFSRNDIEADADDTIVRRELTAAGKSRAFINDSPVPLALLKELGERLVDVHSQHQNLLLQKQDFQMSLVDIIADDAALLADYREAYATLAEARRRLAEAEADIEDCHRQKDFLTYQYDELLDARLISGEQEELEQRSDTMSHAEDIKGALYQADNALSADATGIVSQLRAAAAALHAVEHVFPATAELAARMDSSYIELKDIAGEVGARLDDIDFDPAELDAVNSRLDRLYDLEKKYHAASVDELISLRDDLGSRLTAMENSDEALEGLRQRVADGLQHCQHLAAALTQRRQTAAGMIEQELCRRLVPLGMPAVRFSVSVEPAQLGANGADKVSMLFSANTSSPLQPLTQVASGGETARVMLSLKAMISGAVKLPTIIFDEIDTGVSGKMAEKMAEIMSEMGRGGRQVLAITHLPQIAARGTHHYKVYKQETAHGTTSHMQSLTADERILEIAQMLSGSAVSAAAVENARELLRADSHNNA